MSDSRTGRLAAAILGLVVVLCLVATAPAYATADAGSFAQARVLILAIEDEFGSPIPPPAGLVISPSTVGPDQQVVEQSGATILTYSGGASISGSGASVDVGFSAGVDLTADPVGVVEAIETTSGGIHFSNGSSSTVVIRLRFFRGHQNQSSVTEHSSETSETFSDIEFSLGPGGSPTSPCNDPLFVDVESTTSSPPDANTNPVEAQFEGTITLPPDETCSVDMLIQASGRADSQTVTVPTAGPLALMLLAILLAAGAVRRLRAA